MALCPYCTQELPPDAHRCPLCERDVVLAEDNIAAETGEEIYDLSNAATKIPLDWQSAAVYTLELPARCPNCREPIRTVRVLRMTRTHVAFTSALPRGGRAIVCPECERIISIELATFN